jgi:hypothetical protein
MSVLKRARTTGNQIPFPTTVENAVQITSYIDEIEEVLLFLKSHTGNYTVNAFINKLERIVESTPNLECEIVEEKPTFPLLDLPEGPIANILYYLSVRELLEFRTCNTLCRKLADSNQLWNSLLIRNFPEISEYKTPKIPSGTEKNITK